MNANRVRKPRDNYAFFDADAVRAAAAAILRLTGPDPDAARHTHQLLEALGRFCRLPGCDADSRGLGLCENHYRVHRRTNANEAHLLNYAARKK